MKKIIVILMAMIMSMSLFSGCASCASQPASSQNSVATTTNEESDVPDESVPGSTGDVSDETTMASRMENNTEAAQTDEFYPLASYGEAMYANGIIFEETKDLTDPFDAYNEEGIQKIQYTSFDNLLDILEETEYHELRLYQGAENVHVGWVGDVLVGDFTFEGEDFVWHFRAETVDQMENHSGIVIPNLEYINHAEQLNGAFIMKADEHWFNWFAEYEEGNPLSDARIIDITIVYFPNTHHQYTFYSQEVRMNATGKFNFQTAPWRVVQTFYDPFGKPCGREWYTDEVSK